MLNVVETIINEESQLRDDTQLISHTCTKLVAYSLLVGRDVLYYLFALFRRENAKICSTDTEVWTDANSCYAYQYTISIFS